ncbi:MAG: type II toxin-antitoxin system RelE/ParE family toxin [Verrucomicrobiales bacterium]|nr:type II toxin-antitoxin system RelE/ParE family toxin [Verrucomicrobiales bacterium]
MAKYKIEFRKSVTKELRILPQQDQIRILQKIAELADDPRPPGCKKLSGQERYRLRQGDYRILYEIQDDRLIITIVRVRHRRDVYD